MRLRSVGFIAAAVTMLTMALATSASNASSVEQTSVGSLPYYLALGDSYSSGNYLPPLIASSGSCARSLSAYPEVTTKRLRIPHLVFVACSGATIAQVSTQVSRVSKYITRARLVTLTAGGNDLPFAGLSEACVGLVASVSAPAIRYIPGLSGQSTCDSATTKTAALLGANLDTSTGMISAAPSSLSLPIAKFSPIESRLTNLYLRILRAEGSAKRSRIGTQLIVVQYPILLGNSGTGNCLLSSARINIPVQTVVNGLYPAFTGQSANGLIQVNRLLNRETAAVVKNLRRQGYARISVVTPPLKFAPLDCQTGSSLDLNGIAVTTSSSGLGNNSLHPTIAGHSLLADSVVARWHLVGH
jgi:hypothetical protein